MSTQAIGAAAAGTAVIGGGGATIAYAAGAFNGEKKTTPKIYENFLEYAKERGLGNVILSLAEIKTKLAEKTNSPTYKETIKDNLNNMTSTVTGVQKSVDGDFAEDPNKDEEISQFTHKWCEVVSKKKKTGNGNDKSWLGAEIEQDSEFDPFQKICLKTQEGQQ
ncbi:hypothetical protein MHSWG343_10840 [Candidatus Mycoplasma haematohominis]|uniref:Uncharacterized protein n=1 Tax=Candidatus Mycoplasma haematohominis TaxID=1494318 RepID=A0A478FUQ9_9MOLU|nr:hypothetical protein MHSWG343_10840 [Candidatus Mycoplasma haemohominis]